MTVTGNPRVQFFDDKKSVMEANLSRKKMFGGRGILYPMLVIAAVAVIALSIFGVATIIGLIPVTESNSVQQHDSRPKTRPQSVQPPVKTARAAPTREIETPPRRLADVFTCGVRQARAAPTRIESTA